MHSVSDSRLGGGERARRLTDPREPVIHRWRSEVMWARSRSGEQEKERDLLRP